MSILATLKEAFAAIASIFSFSKHRSEIKNAPDVKAAAIAKQEQKQVDAANKAVASGDIDEIRKQAAE